ncbi:MAG: hypothetical protein ACRDCW_08400, partial [Sarcina sp.]
MLSKKVMATMLTGAMVTTAVVQPVVGHQENSQHKTLLASNNKSGVTASAERNTWLKNEMNKVIKARNLGVQPLDDHVVMNFQEDSGFMPVGKIFLSTNTNLNGVLIKISNSKGEILAQGNLTKQETIYTSPSGEKIKESYYTFEKIAGTDKYLAQPGNDTNFGLNTCHVEYQGPNGFEMLKNKEGKPIVFTQNIIPLTFYTENVEVPKLVVGKEYKYGNGVDILGTVTPFAGVNGVPTVRVCSNFGGTINFYDMNESNQSLAIASLSTSLTDKGITIKTTNPLAENDYYYNPGIIYNTIASDAFNEPSITMEVKTQSNTEYPLGQYVSIDGTLHAIEEPTVENTQDVLQQNLKGVPYTSANLEKPIIPKGYSIVGLSINGQKIKLKDNETYENYPLPNYFTDGNQDIVYTIVKNSKDTVTVKTKDGQYVTSSGSLTNVETNQQVLEGKEGEEVNFKKPIVPDHYGIVEVLLNGKKVSIADLPKKFSATNDDITYIVAPEVSITRTVEVINPYTNKPVHVEGISGNSTITSGLEGTTVNVPTYANPDSNKYTMTESGVKAGEQTLTKDGVQTITLTQKKASLTTETTVDGKIIKTPQVVDGVVGQEINVGTPESQPGYHVGSVTVNGKTYTGKEMANV